MRTIDFDDSFGTENAPSQGSVAQNALKVFADDAAFVTDKGSAAADGDIYYNSTSDQQRQHANGGFFDNGPGAASIPAGTVFDFAGPEGSIPAGYLICDGASVTTAAFPGLFAAIAYQYGGGGANFNVPDLRGRVSAGKDDMGGGAASRMTSGESGVDGATLGAVGGVETHQLTTAELAAHNHVINITDPGHSHNATIASFLVNSTSGGDYAGGANPALAVPATATKVTGITSTSDNKGDGDKHQNTQPTIILNKMIKT